MPSSVIFRTTSGQSPEQLITHLVESIWPSQEAMLYAGSRQITRIRERTAAGQDVDGAPFTEYSPQYAKVRQKRGRNVSPVDLLMSGRLLNSMRVEVRAKDEFAITVQDVDAATYGRSINDGLGNQPQRRFFDVSPPELDEVGADMLQFMRVSV